MLVPPASVMRSSMKVPVPVVMSGLRIDLEEDRRLGQRGDLVGHRLDVGLHLRHQGVGRGAGAHQQAEVVQVVHRLVERRRVDHVDLHAQVLELAAQAGLDAAGGQHEVGLHGDDLLDARVGEVADLGQRLGGRRVVVVGRAGDHLAAGADGEGDLGVGRRQADDALAAAFFSVTGLPASSLTVIGPAARPTATRRPVAVPLAGAAGGQDGGRQGQSGQQQCDDGGPTAATRTPEDHACRVPSLSDRRVDSCHAAHGLDV